MFARTRRNRFVNLENSLSNRQRLGRTFRPHLEVLEDRTVPSTVTWIGGSGDWSTGSNWSNGSGPGFSDDAQINTAGVVVTHSADTHTVHSVTLTSTAALSLVGGTLYILGNLQSATPVSLNGIGTFGTATLANATIAAGTTVRVTSAFNNILEHVTVNGTLDMHTWNGSRATINSGLTLNTTLNLGGPGYALLAPSGSQTISGTGQIVMNGDQGASTSGIVNGSGTLTLAVPVSGRGTISNSSSMTVVNTRTIQATSGELLLGDGTQVNQGTYAATSNGTLTILEPGTTNLTNYSGGTLIGGTWQVIGLSTMRLINRPITTNAATFLLDGAGSNVYTDSFLPTNALASFAANAAAGDFTIRNGRTLTTSGAFSNAGSLTVGNSSTFTAGGLYTQTGGSTTLQGGTLTSVSGVNIQSGALSGSGSIQANVTSGGQSLPGAAGAAGTITVNGHYTQSSAGSLEIDLGGTTAGSQYDQLNLTSGKVATLDGTLNVHLINGFTPALGQTFTILNFGSRVGTFATITGLNLGNGLVLVPVYNSGNLTLVTSLANSPPSANAGGPYQILEGQSLTLDASASQDPDNDTLSYAWTVNGVANAASGVNPTLTWAQLQALGIDDGNPTTTFSITVQVDDGHGHVVTSAGTTLTLNNAAPTGTLASDGAVAYGNASTVHFSNASDPSAADTSAGFHYAFSTDANALTSATYANSGGTDSWSYLFAHAGTYTVYARIIDKDDGFTPYSVAVTVDPRALNVTATAANKVYDGTDTASVTLSDDRISGDTFTTNFTSASFIDRNVGTNKTVTASGLSISGGNSADYTLASTTVTATASISPTTLTVTADPATRVYGAPNPVFTATLSGFVNGETLASLGGSLSFATPATADSPLGSYPVTPQGLTSTNYDIHYQDSTLTVTDLLLQGGSLLLGGTSGDDTFTFTPGTTAGSVVVKLNATTLGTFTPSSSIVAYGGPGNDAVIVNGTKVVNSFTLDVNQVSLNGLAYLGDRVENWTINALGNSDTITALGGSATINGGSGKDQLIAAMPGDNTWNITARNAGTLNGTIVFNSVASLTGGVGMDVFHLADGAGVSGEIDGGSGQDEVDYSTWTSAVSVHLQTGAATRTGGITSIETVTGGSAQDTLIGANGISDWALNGADQGVVNGTFRFRSFENITGGTQIDTFHVNPGASVSGTLKGGGGADVLDFSAFGSPVTVNLASSSATGVGDFSSIAVLVGSAAADILVGADNNNTWSLTAADSGTVDGTAFSSFESLLGGRRPTPSGSATGWRSAAKSRPDPAWIRSTTAPARPGYW